MPIASRLVHHLAIERVTDGTRDEYGVPDQTWALLTLVRGLIQPKTAVEVAQLTQGGAVASTDTIYLLPTDVTESDRIRFDPDDGRRYQVVGVRDAAGLGHHLELDATLVKLPVS